MSTKVVYGGKNESPGKAKARTWAYSYIPRNSLYNKIHIVIASRDCGDIRYLLSIGVTADKIVACDIDSEARKEAAKYGVWISPHHAIEDTVQWALEIGLDVYSVNVDLCCSLVQAVHSIKKVIGARIPLTMLTYRRGRDHSVLKMYPGCDSDVARMCFLRQWTGRLEDGQEHYHSFTKTSQGSSMGVCIWKQRKAPNRKPKAKSKK